MSEHVTVAGNFEGPAFFAVQQLGFTLERRIHPHDTEWWKASEREIHDYLRTYYPQAHEEGEWPKP